MRLAQRLLTGLTVCAVACAVAGVGHARPSTVAVVAVEMKGNVAPELRSQLQRSIVRGIKQAKQRMVSKKKLRRALRKTPELRNCTSTTCLQRIGELTRANRFVKASVDGSGAAYTVNLELLSADPNNRVVAQRELKCAVCTITDLSAKVSSTTAALFTSGGNAPVDITITTRPEGAKLRVNDKDIGASPYTGKLAPGTYRVTALLAGHKETEQTIEVKGGKERTNRFEIILAKVKKQKPVKQPQPPPPPPKRPYKLLKFAAAGAGGIALIAGMVFLGRTDNGTCTPVAPVTECERLHDDGALGAVSLGVGVGLLGVSAWMWLKDRKHAAESPQPRRGAVFTPTRGGAFVGWHGSF